MRAEVAVLMGVLAAFAATPAGTEEAPALLKPPALPKGGTVGLVAPASPLNDSLTRAAVQNLEKRGYRVKVSPESRGRKGYLAGDDEARASALNALVADPSVDAILCLRGGYGSPRLLDRIDYEAFRAHPKILVGYSDITGLLLAVHRRSRVVVFHGPMGKEWSVGRGLSPWSEKYFWPALAPESALFEDWGGERAPGMKSPTTIVPGIAEGTLVGGNLSVLCSTVGTPYEIDAAGAVLFIEEVSEKNFRIDRLLNQLRLAGILARAKGILLGGFTGCDVRDPEGDIPLAQVFEDYFRPLGIPVLADYPAGHLPDQAMLPLGIRVRLDAGAKKLTLLEPPVAREAPGGDAGPGNAR